MTERRTAPALSPSVVLMALISLAAGVGGAYVSHRFGDSDMGELYQYTSYALIFAGIYGLLGMRSRWLAVLVHLPPAVATLPFAAELARETLKALSSPYGVLSAIIALIGSLPFLVCAGLLIGQYRARRPNPPWGPRRILQEGVAALVALAVCLVGLSLSNKQAAQRERQRLAQLQELHSGSHFRPVGALAFSPDGSTLATASESIKLWEVATGRQLAESAFLNGQITHLAFTPSGGTLLGTRESLQKLLRLSLPSLKIVDTPALSLNRLFFAVDEDTVYNQGRFYDLNTAQEREQERLAVPPETQSILKDSFTSRDSIQLMGTNKSLWHYDGAGFHTLSESLPAVVPPTPGCAYGQLSTLSGSPRGGYLAAGYQEGNVLVWDLKARQHILALSARGQGETDDPSRCNRTFDGTLLAITPQEDRLVSVRQSVLKIWSLPEGKLLHEKRLADPPTLMALSPDGERMALASMNKAFIMPLADPSNPLYLSPPKERNTQAP